MAEPVPVPDNSEIAETPAPPPTVPPVPSLPSIADGLEHPLDPRSVALARIVGWLFIGPLLVVLFGGVGLAVSRASNPVWIEALLVVLGSAAALGLGWSAQRWPGIEHRHASYKVDEWGIEIRRGVLWRKEIHVPRSRVQHTDVSQGPLQRSYGLATLVIYTAGTEYAKVELAGLDHSTALRIRDHLLVGRGSDAV